MTPQDILDRVDLALKGATAGPWKAYSDETFIRSPEGVVIGDYPASLMTDDDGHSRMREEGTDEDRKFIAESRTLVPELAAALRSARSEIERLRREVDEYGHDLHGLGY